MVQDNSDPEKGYSHDHNDNHHHHGHEHEHEHEHELHQRPSSSSAESASESPRFEAIKPPTTKSRRSSAETQRIDNEELYQTLGHVTTTDLETEAERRAREPLAYTRTGASLTSVASRPAEFEVTFDENDPENPKCWSLSYRCWCVFVASFGTWATTLYSSSYTASTPGLVEEFGTSTTLVTMGLTTYLLGLAAGTLVFAPMSELYGRRMVYIVGLTCWAILIIPAGVAKSLTTIIVVRFFECVFQTFTP
jgi:hypothetical protein